MPETIPETIIDVIVLPIDEAKHDYAHLFNTFQQLLTLNDEQAALAVSITVGTCHHCYEKPKDCQCWNDQ